MMQVLSDIRWFMVVLLVLVVGFGHAFFLVAQVAVFMALAHTTRKEPVLSPSRLSVCVCCLSPWLTARAERRLR